MDEGYSKPEDYLDVYEDGEYLIIYSRIEKKAMMVRPHDARYIIRQLQLLLQHHKETL